MDISDIHGRSHTVSFQNSQLSQVDLSGPDDETRRDNRRWLEDFVYHNGRLLAATRRNESGGEDRFAFALDHLGSTRQVYDWSGALVESHSYYPFGQEIGAPGEGDFVHKYTGHERDPNAFGMGTLDYVHARYTSPVVGRFLTVDPVGGIAGEPSTWNRYSYVLNRPTIFKDSRGLFPGSEIYVDLCLVMGACFDDLTIVTSTYLPLYRDLSVLFGYPTYGKDGTGLVGDSPPADRFDLMDILQEAKANWLNVVPFAIKSRTGGSWDPKQLCDRSNRTDPCQHFGNYVWGMLAAATGISLEVAQRGAGAYSYIGGRAQDPWVNPPGSSIPLQDPPYGDDPTDSFWIQMGWIEYQRVGREIPWKY